ncbi:hypothetical protein AV530_019661 [Patagioenas fasciata monilis]|uniref:Uncharacterized protein n=1 Tax=Patagioenas fasciata monilis TaxID=372326 RepID=A0A1V4JEQ7_PATFA|nr:hypothetical protein AV530_019661 [Patagioenas fasciata monilis]
MEAKTTFKIATRGTSICNVAEDVSNNGTLIELGFNIHKQSFKCRWLSEDARKQGVPSVLKTDYASHDATTQITTWFIRLSRRTSHLLLNTKRMQTLHVTRRV